MREYMGVHGMADRIRVVQTIAKGKNRDLV